jgi:hypothetical protein
MTNIQIQRMIEDIQDVLNKGQIALNDDDLGYPYVAGYYYSVLKTLLFMLKQEL